MREEVKVAEEEQRCGEICKEGEEGRARDKTSGGAQSQAAEGRGRRRLAHTSHRGGEELRDQETDEATEATRG